MGIPGRGGRSFPEKTGGFRPAGAAPRRKARFFSGKLAPRGAVSGRQCRKTRGFLRARFGRGGVPHGIPQKRGPARALENGSRMVFRAKRWAGENGEGQPACTGGRGCPSRSPLRMVFRTKAKTGESAVNSVKIGHVPPFCGVKRAFRPKTP
jgi:hypothetical protein